MSCAMNNSVRLEAADNFDTLVQIGNIHLLAVTTEHLMSLLLQQKHKILPQLAG
ncbi:hypothetical protein D3C73_1266740 [compost metagenome]